MLLEREGERRAIADALAVARSGQGCAVVIRGAAGIGKTRLMTAALADEPVVLTARGGELERDFAFGIARQLFEQAVVADRALLQGAAELARPVVTLAEDHDVTPTGDRLFATMHGLYWLCVNLAPVVLAVDDLHWADEQSVRWLSYLVRRLPGVPVAVVLATRPEDNDAVAAILAEPSTVLVEPAPLGVAAAAAIVKDVTGAEPSPEVAAACHARSAGNPFVLRELAVALAGRGMLSVGDVASVLPGTVTRGLLSRLVGLSEAAVALARAIAVLGTDVHLVDAARVAELGDGMAARALDELVDAGFVEPGTPLRFAHPLMGEAIYDDLPTGSRLLQHRRAAEVLQARIAPERIAAHLLQCEPRGDAESVAVLRRSAARAIERGAAETAVRYLARALAEPPAEADRGAVLCELGTAEARVGRPEAGRHLEDALERAASAEEIATATSQLSISRGARGDMGGAADALELGIDLIGARAQDAGDDARPRSGAEATLGLPPGPARELALRLEGELGALAQLDPNVAKRVRDRLRRIAPDLPGATVGERLVLASYAHMRSNELAPPAELLDLATRAAGDGRLVTDQTADSPIVYLLVYVFFRAGDSAAADRWLDAALAEARGRGSLLGTSIALGVRSQLRWLRGELADAEADAQTSIDAQVEAEWASVLPLAVGARGECLLERGEVRAALQLFDDTGLGGPLPPIHTYRWAQVTRGRARVMAGQIDAGLEDMLDCGRGHQLGARPDIVLPWRTEAALAYAARGDEAEARQLAAEQVALTREAGVARPLGTALRTLGIIDRDEALLREAVAVLAASSARLEHARAMVDLGALIRRAGRRRDAREQLEAGYEVARRCGATALADRAAEELAASGVRLRRPALTGRDALTPSERRVAELAVTGLSNPEIAQALFVTRKTIEMHLGNAYRKLGVNRREALGDALEDASAYAVIS